MAKDHASDTDYKRKEKPYSMHKEHWEIKYHEKPPNDAKNRLMGSQFNPIQSKDRYKTYVPVNETDT